MANQLAKENLFNIGAVRTEFAMETKEWNLIFFVPYRM
jgi:hypothetical protein